MAFVHLPFSTTTRAWATFTLAVISLFQESATLGVLSSYAVKVDLDLSCRGPFLVLQHVHSSSHLAVKPLHDSNVINFSLLSLKTLSFPPKCPSHCHVDKPRTCVMITGCHHKHGSRGCPGFALSLPEPNQCKASLNIDRSSAATNLPRPAVLPA